MTKEMLRKNVAYRNGSSFDRWYYTSKTRQEKRFNCKTLRMEEVTVYIFNGPFDAVNVGYTEDEIKRFNEV